MALDCKQSLKKNVYVVQTDFFKLSLNFVLFAVLLLAEFSPPLDKRSLGPWRSEVTGHRLFAEEYSPSPSLTPHLPSQAYLSLEGQNGEEAGEENIVYL